LQSWLLRVTWAWK